MLKLASGFLIGVLVSVVSLYGYFEEEVYAELLKSEKEIAAHHESMRALDFSFVVIHRKNVLRALIQGKNCYARQLLAQAIIGDVEFIRLVNNENFSTEKLNEIVELSTPYYPLNSEGEYVECE